MLSRYPKMLSTFCFLEWLDYHMKMTQHQKFFFELLSHIFFFPSSSSLLLAFCLLSSQASLSVSAAAAASFSSATSAVKRLAPRFSLMTKQSVRRRWYWGTIWSSAQLSIHYSIVNADQKSRSSNLLYTYNLVDVLPVDGLSFKILIIDVSLLIPIATQIQCEYNALMYPSPILLYLFLPLSIIK